MGNGGWARRDGEKDRKIQNKKRLTLRTNLFNFFSRSIFSFEALSFHTPCVVQFLCLRQSKDTQSKQMKKYINLPSSFFKPTKQVRYTITITHLYVFYMLRKEENYHLDFPNLLIILNGS